MENQSGIKKSDSWVQLRDLHGRISQPWLVLGDFNEILYNTEKEGGVPRPQRYMQAFHDAFVRLWSGRFGL